MPGTLSLEPPDRDRARVVTVNDAGRVHVSAEREIMALSSLSGSSVEPNGAWALRLRFNVMRDIMVIYIIRE